MTAYELLGFGAALIVFLIVAAVILYNAGHPDLWEQSEEHDLLDTLRRMR
jgi:hypothetical protein